MYKVLLVEDEELERRYLKTLLEQPAWGYKVVGEARNGREGIDLCSALQPDIVFLDIRMPGIDGLAAAEVIKGSNPNIRILLLSAYDEFSYAKQAIHLGVNEYLLKPAQPEEILAALRSLTFSCNTDSHTFNSLFSGIDPEDYLAANYPLEKEKEIIVALEERDFKLFNNSLNDVMQSLINNCQNIPAVKIRIYELVIIICKGLNDCGYDAWDVHNFKLQKFQEIERIDSLGAVREYLAAFRKDFLELVNLDETNADKYAEAIISYINAHKSENITISKLSSCFHFSPCHISRLIRKKTGQTYPQYLNKLRLSEAKELLRNSDLDINVIAVSAGYNEVSHFNRIFKKALGLSPSKYRSLFTESKENSFCQVRV